ncbi:GNAT family N-acetyltransferase [Aquimarina sp. AD1]|uniref:GNAT family N-acetyltransferase n=1 Tax=Aquimarina TaxID=290174 RepID=UPI0003FD9BDB|nr:MULTISPECIES: GNAT family N-acetyltransferase [Aquimarina]AXT57417.1 GNAT family N-acetyltransferase [Aquimarina sp. AD1]RKN32741.1 GNAT family N-acetyltransferase [Aquimarina sp. AD1]
MSFFPKTYSIKNNHTVTIRQAVSDDASNLLKLKLQYLKNTETLPLFENEYPNDIDQERDFIERFQSEKNSIILVALCDDVMIGNIDLTGSWRKKMEHTGMIGMGIHTQWQNQGIGTLLLQNAIDWAHQNEILKVIWLEVYESNQSGIALYKKTGFTQSGIIPNFFLEKDVYIDKIIMYREV